MEIVLISFNILIIGIKCEYEHEHEYGVRKEINTIKIWGTLWIGEDKAKLKIWKLNWRIEIND